MNGDATLRERVNALRGELDGAKCARRLADERAEVAENRVAKLVAELEAVNSRTYSVMYKTLRDEFAIAAMGALPHMGCGGDLDLSDASLAAYQWADAMLKVRKEGAK